MNFIFDVDDTLYDQFVPFEQAYQKNFEYDNQVPIEALYRFTRMYSDEVFEQTQAKMMSMEDMYIYRLSKAFQEFNVSITPNQALKFQEDYSHFQKSIQLSPAMKKILTDFLLKKISIGVITNGPADHQQNKIEALKLFKWIDRKNMFVSGKLKMAKPSKEIFDYVATQMSLDPKETFYIGDSFNNDVVGAKNAGWQSIWLNRRKHVLKNSDLQPDFIVENDDELALLLKKLV